MNIWLKMLLWFLGGLALVMVLEIGGIQWQRITKPMKADVERVSFEKTRAFNLSVAQDIAKFHLEYATASDSDKAVIKQVVLHMMSEYDDSKLDPTLRAWIVELRGY